MCAEASELRRLSTSGFLGLYPRLYSSFSARRAVAAGCALGIGCLLQPAVAQQQQNDVLSVILQDVVRQDSNLFRLPDKTSDTINTASIGLRLDKPYHQQRFQLGITETVTRYAKNSRLDFEALNYNGTWHWHLTPRLNGTLSASRSKTLVPFNQTTVTGTNNRRNTRTSENQAFTLDGWLFGGWHVLGGLSQSDQRSGQATQTAADFSDTSGDIGIKYLAPSGNAITATRRLTDGRFKNQNTVPGLTDYTQHETELKANWAVTGQSALTGRLAWRERENNRQASARDFSGLVGDAGYTWKVTGSVILNVLASHDRGPLQDTSFRYFTTNRLSTGAVWKITDKTSARLNLGLTELDYRGRTATAPAGPARNDTEKNAELGLDWLVMRSLSVGASLERRIRTSNTPGVEFNANIVNLNAALTF